MHLLSGFALITAGLITIALTYYKPSPYWNKSSVRFVKNLIGDTGAAIFYYAIAICLLIVGTVVIFSK
jgi:hypothetical protein